MIIEEIRDCQAEEVSILIRRNLQENNSKDYPPDIITYLLNCYSAENILANAKKQHIYVAIEDGKLIGTGGLANFGSLEKPSYYGVAMFVVPELQGKGIGSQILRKVEEKAKELGARKLTIRAAIGAQPFYEKLGYKYRNNQKLQDDSGNYIMEKEF